MSWIVVESSPFRSVVSKLLKVLGAGQSAARSAGSPRLLRQAAGWVHAWLAAVLLLIAWQSAEVSGSFSLFLNSPAWIVPHVAWDSLFALAALFTAQSKPERADEAASLLLTRILAPLWLTVLLSCFLLGPLISSRGIGDYLRDQETWTYLSNLYAWPQFHLPGVFEFTNFSAMVNEALWSLPWLVLSCVIAAVTLRFRRGVLVSAAGAALALGAAIWFAASSATSGGVPDQYLQMGLAVVASGQMASAASRLRRPKPVLQALGASALLLGIALAGDRLPSALPFLQPLTSLPATALALAAARVRWSSRELATSLSPYAFAALVSAFPVQQLMLVVGGAQQSPMVNFLESLPFAALLAFFFVSSARLALRTLTPVPIEPLSRYDLRRALALMPSSRTAGVSAAFFSIFALIVMAILWMTLFALQRNPWEN
jgi:hypothetical protein